MEMDLTFLRRFFKGFYNVIIVFVAVTIAFFLLSYYSHVRTIKTYVYDLHQEVITLIAQDLKHVNYHVEDPYSFYQKYNTADMKLINSILVIGSDGAAFFTANAEKRFAYQGIEKNGDIRLGNLVLADNIISTKRLEDGTELMILTSQPMIQSFVFNEWIAESRVQFSLSILVPIIILVLLMLIEDKLIKDLQNKFMSYFDAIEGKDQEREELYRGLYFKNRCVMLLIDPKTGQVIDGNESAMTYYGYKFKEEYVKVSDINTMPQEELEKIMEDALEKRRNYFNFQHKLSNGMVRDVEVYSGPVIMEGRPLLCSIVHDVTDKIRAEQILLNQQLEMERSIHEKSEVLATISHEIKTPIAGIIHNVNDLAGKIKDPDQQTQLQFLKLNINNLNRLVFDLLDYSRIETGSLKFYSTQFDLMEVLDASLQLFKPLALEKHIQMSFDLTGLKRHRFVGDAFRIGQIVNNLISNSIKFTHDGSIRITAWDEAMDHQSLVTIVVEDTGIGMKPEVVEQIFKRFYTTDTSGEMGGTGLGLAICRHIVEAMDGTLEVSSEPGVGTQMTLILELDNDDGADMSMLSLNELLSVRTEPLEAAEKPVIHALIVDDDPMSTLFVEKMLKQVNFLEVKVDNAYNGKEALEMLAVKPYQCIFCDHQLPDLLGTQLITAAKTLTSDPDSLKTVLMSADYIDAHEARADMFLLKPINLNGLEQALMAFYGGKSATEAAPTGGSGLRASHHKYIGYSEIEELAAFVGDEEVGAICRIFVSAIEEKMALLPEMLEPARVPEVLRVIHGIKGSISYIKSEAFIQELAETETTLLSSGDFEAMKRRYQQFYAEFGKFIKEASLMEQFVAAQFKQMSEPQL